MLIDYHADATIPTLYYALICIYVEMMSKTVISIKVPGNKGHSKIETKDDYIMLEDIHAICKNVITFKFEENGVY